LYELPVKGGSIIFPQPKKELPVDMVPAGHVDMAQPSVPAEIIPPVNAPVSSTQGSTPAAQ